MCGGGGAALRWRSGGGEAELEVAGWRVSGGGGGGGGGRGGAAVLAACLLAALRRQEDIVIHSLELELATDALLQSQKVNDTRHS